MQNKYVNENGDVAILYSPGYGAGWYSWNSDHPDCIFNPELVTLVMQKNQLEAESESTDLVVQTIRQKAQELYGTNGKHFYDGGADQLRIEWLPEGTPFEIHEYDGYESVQLGDREWLLA